MKVDHYISEEKRRKILDSCSLSFDYASTDWRNGLLLGNGDLGAVAYASGNREWVINKNDVFDRRDYGVNMKTHEEIMSYIKNNNEKHTYFIDDIEKATNGFTLRSITPVILRQCYGSGELGWSAPAYPKFSDTLSFYNGEIDSVADAHFIHSSAKSIIPHQRRVFAVRLQGCSICDWDNKFEIYRPYSDDLDFPEFSSFCKGGLAFTQTLPQGKGSYAVALLVVSRDPDVTRVTYDMPYDFDYSKKKPYISDPHFTKLSAYVTVGGDADIYVSVCSDYTDANPLLAAIEEVKNAAAVGFSRLSRENRNWWHDFWSTSFADFGNHSDLQRYWVSSVYTLAASFCKAPMPALSGMLYGPLSPTAPGVTSHQYNTDQNTQIPLMPAAIINHPEFVEALADTYILQSEVYKSHTKELFSGTGGEGIFVPLVTNQSGQELASGSYRYTMCGSAYTALVLARTWEYTRCDDLMRNKFFGLLCEFIRFYVNNLMTLGEDGLYHLDYTVPPEIFMFTRDDLSTLSMLKSCIKTVLKWAEMEKIDNEEISLWKDILSKYPTPTTRKDGSYKGGPDIPDEYFSFGTHQLYPFFPAEEYIGESDRIAAEKTIEYINVKAIERTYSGLDGWHFLHGWSWFLYYGTLLHLGKSIDIFEVLNRFISYFAKGNGLFVHNSIVSAPSEVTEKNHFDYKRLDEITADSTNCFSWYGTRCASPNEFSKDLTAPVVEGGSIFLLLSSEALLQSYDEIIHLFPAVPSDFSGSFAGFKAKGGCSVSAKMENGKLVCAEISSPHKQTVRIEDRGLRIQGTAWQKNTVNGKQVIEFEILPDQTVQILPV